MVLVNMHVIIDGILELLRQAFLALVATFVIKQGQKSYASCCSESIWAPSVACDIDYLDYSCDVIVLYFID